MGDGYVLKIDEFCSLAPPVTSRLLHHLDEN